MGAIIDPARGALGQNERVYLRSDLRDMSDRREIDAA